MEKKIYKVSEMVKLGYPRQFVLDCCNSIYSSRFAFKTCENGIWLIDLKKFEDLLSRGAFKAA